MKSWTSPVLAVVMVLGCLGLWSCEEREEKSQLLENLDRQIKANRALRAKVRDLERRLREPAGESPALPSPKPRSNVDEDAENLRIKALAAELEEVEYALSEAREQARSRCEDPTEAARDFLMAVVRSDRKNLDGLVDWEGLARETYRRDGGDPPYAKLSQRRKAEILAETRKRFEEAFADSGPGREILMSLVGEGQPGSLPPDLVRVDLSDGVSAVSSRWSILLRRNNAVWKVVGVLQESLEAPAEEPGAEEPGGDGEGQGSGEFGENR